MPAPDIHMDRMNKRNEDFGIGSKMQLETGSCQERGI
jgi:hypothetical protein